VIVKVKDPNKVIRDGIEQPNTSYYRSVFSVLILITITTIILLKV